MVLKAALCFILNYEHTLVKEHIWRKWIDANADIINVYFFYKEGHLDKIASPWIRDHVIPAEYITPTSYLHVVPAYLALMRNALRAHGGENEWVVFLTDFCVPLTTPATFRRLFFAHYHQSFVNWRPAWWNVATQHRANLRLLPERYHLANPPWFTLTRRHAELCLDFCIQQPRMAKMVFDGIVANESIFAVMLEWAGVLKDGDQVIRANSHIADWDRMSSATSPHIFEAVNDRRDREFLARNKAENPYVMFLRKVSPALPDAILTQYLGDDVVATPREPLPLALRLPLWIHRNKIFLWKLAIIVAGIWLGYLVAFFT